MLQNLEGMIILQGKIVLKLDRGQLGTGIVGLCASLNVARISVNVSQVVFLICKIFEMLDFKKNRCF